MAMVNAFGGAPITLENEIDGVPPPAHFIWISSPIIRPPVPEPDPSFLVGCACQSADECRRGTCLCISQGNDPKPVYSSDGRLLIESGPIYECNAKCTCSPGQCPNRVIQRGRTVPLTIARFGGGKGWGVKAADDIPRGTFVDLYLGEVLTATEGNHRFQSADGGAAGCYLFDLDFNYEAGTESAFTVDAYTHGNITHFINHSCEPNLRVYPCFLDTWDPRLHRLAFFAMRDIRRGEELCFDYLGNQGAAQSPRGRKGAQRKATTSCACGAPTCRGFIY